MSFNKMFSACLLPVLCGCGTGEDQPTAADQMVFVDLRTRDAVVTAPTDVIPAEHPVTGERSLMPGLYCGECRQWHPAPPLEELQRNPEAHKCPHCRGAMSTDGPWPDSIEP